MNYSVWITSRCNMICDYCYENKRKSEHMTLETAQKTIEYVTDPGHQASSIHIHGGEVFTNIEVLDYLVTECCKRKIETHLTTNGTLINGELSRNIIRRISRVSISIDGNHDVYLRNRHFVSKEQNFEKLLNTINELLQINNDTIARMTITPNNVHDFMTSLNYIISLGFKRISYAIDYNNKAWSEQTINVLFEELSELKKRTSNYLKTGIIVNGIANDKPHRLSVCMGGVYRQDIFIDGKIYPCSSVIDQGEFCIGDVTEGICKEWKDTLCDINIHHMNGVCENCNNKEFCRAVKCRFVNYSFTENLYKPSCVMCNIQKRKMKFSNTSYENCYP